MSSRGRFQYKILLWRNKKINEEHLKASILKKNEIIKMNELHYI